MTVPKQSMRVTHRMERMSNGSFELQKSLVSAGLKNSRQKDLNNF
jgi:hypothetical protein